MNVRSGSLMNWGSSRGTMIVAVVVLSTLLFAVYHLYYSSSSSNVKVPPRELRKDDLPKPYKPGKPSSASPSDKEDQKSGAEEHEDDSEEEGEEEEEEEDESQEYDPNRPLPASLYARPGFDADSYQNALKRCADKIAHCKSKQSKWFEQSPICLASSTTDHTPNRISEACNPELFHWKRGCSVTESAFYVIAAEDIGNIAYQGQCACVMLLVVEPPRYLPHVVTNVQNHYDSVDLIFSSFLVKNDPQKKVFPFSYGSTWVRLPERQIYPKTKEISIIASNKRTTDGHQLRHAVIDRFRTKYHFEVFGGGYRPIDRKVDGLKDFRYSIVIENTREEYWMTEKLMDAFLTGTIPIYWGAPVATQLFDTQGMLTFESADDLEEVLQRATAKYYQENLVAVQRNFEQAKRWACPEDRLWQDTFQPMFGMIPKY